MHTKDIARMPAQKQTAETAPDNNDSAIMRATRADSLPPRAGVTSKTVFDQQRPVATPAMTPEPTPIRRLQLLLRDPCRTAAARAAARLAAEQLGMQISGEGHATLSARMPDDAFQQLFSCSSGASGTLTVPSSLEPYVSSISEAPQHLSFD